MQRNCHCPSKVKGKVGDEEISRRGGHERLQAAFHIAHCSHLPVYGLCQLCIGISLIAAYQCRLVGMTEGILMQFVFNPHPY